VLTGWESQCETRFQAREAFRKAAREFVRRPPPGPTDSGQGASGCVAVPPFTYVATDWAGNSVDVLLSTYAKWLVEQDKGRPPEISKRRISKVLSRETWARIRRSQPPEADDSRILMRDRE
jgi:hypothetical protein